MGSIGDIGTMDFNDPEQKEKLLLWLSEVPALQNKAVTTDTLEKVTRAYAKKYRIRHSLIYSMETSYLTHIEHKEYENSEGYKQLTTVYALTMFEMFAKIVTYCYKYTRRKYGEN